MREFIETAWIIMASVVIGLIVVVGTSLCLTLGNAHWECHAYHEKTGVETQVIGGDCFVKDGEKWEVFSAYINQYHVDSK